MGLHRPCSDEERLSDFDVIGVECDRDPKRPTAGVRGRTQPTLVERDRGDARSAIAHLEHTGQTALAGCGGCCRSWASLMTIQAVVLAYETGVVNPSQPLP